MGSLVPSNNPYELGVASVGRTQQFAMDLFKVTDKDYRYNLRVVENLLMLALAAQADHFSDTEASLNNYAALTALTSGELEVDSLAASNNVISGIVGAGRKRWELAITAEFSEYANSECYNEVFAVGLWDAETLEGAQFWFEPCDVYEGPYFQGDVPGSHGQDMAFDADRMSEGVAWMQKSLAQGELASVEGFCTRGQERPRSFAGFDDQSAEEKEIRRHLAMWTSIGVWSKSLDKWRDMVESVQPKANSERLVQRCYDMCRQVGLAFPDPADHEGPAVPEVYNTLRTYGFTPAQSLTLISRKMLQGDSQMRGKEQRVLAGAIHGALDDGLTPENVWGTPVIRSALKTSGSLSDRGLMREDLWVGIRSSMAAKTLAGRGALDTTSPVISRLL